MQNYVFGGSPARLREFSALGLLLDFFSVTKTFLTLP